MFTNGFVLSVLAVSYKVQLFVNFIHSVGIVLLFYVLKQKK